jgi:hypothetical protein
MTIPHMAVRVPTFACWAALTSGALKTEVVRKAAAARTE